MVKFEVVYSGSTRKISLFDGRILKMTDGRKIFMPEKDWHSTFSKTGNFKLVVKEPEEIEEVIKAEEENTPEEKPEEKKKKKRKRGY